MTVVDASWEVQKAVYAALNADGTLGALITGVYDYVPKGTAAPYVIIGEDDASWTGTFQRNWLEVDIEITSWTEGARGRKTLKEIMDAVANVLHKGTLSLATWTHISTLLESTDTFRDEDALTFQGVQTFRVICHE